MKRAKEPKNEGKPLHYSLNRKDFGYDAIMTASFSRSGSNEQRILGFQHPLLKLAASLHRSKGRRESQRMLIEGKHPLEEALQANVRFEAILLLEQTPSPEPALGAQRVPHYRLNLEQMRRACDTDSPAPVLGIAHLPETSTLASLKAEKPLLVLDGLQDPGNVGTLLRSAWAFGIDQVLLLAPSVDVYSPKVIRSSAGGVFHLTCCSCPQPDDLEPTLMALKAQGFLPVLTTGNTDSVTAISAMPQKALSQVALVLGQEGTGIRLPAKAWGQYPCWSVAMLASVDSLNVAVSGSILMASWFEQRKPQETHTPKTAQQRSHG
jgi:RNA methyltransferase, TrmH family